MLGDFNKTMQGVSLQFNQVIALQSPEYSLALLNLLA